MIKIPRLPNERMTGYPFFPAALLPVLGKHDYRIVFLV
jgi:hypothetical protein